jgi:TM2 domain-containing membrane protein YozV
MTRYCTKCGATNDESAQYCVSCQAPLSPVGTYEPMQSVNPGQMTDWKAAGGDKKVIAGILGILLGWAGVHKFILGYTTEGLIMALVSIVGGIFTCGITTMVVSVIGIVEGIMYLTKSDEEFVRTYLQGRKGWF